MTKVAEEIKDDILKTNTRNWKEKYNISKSLGQYEGSAKMRVHCIQFIHLKNRKSLLSNLTFHHKAPEKERRQGIIKIRAEFVTASNKIK